MFVRSLDCKLTEKINPVKLPWVKNTRRNFIYLLKTITFATRNSYMLFLNKNYVKET